MLNAAYIGSAFVLVDKKVREGIVFQKGQRLMIEVKLPVKLFGGEETDSVVVEWY